MRTLFAIVVLVVATPAFGDKLLLLDSRVIERVENARLRPGTVTKHPANPLFLADKPWENSLNNLYPNVIWDDEEGVFKMWYKCVLADKDAIARMDQPSTVHDVGWYLLYATSRDAITWDKPKLGLHAFGGTKDTNIVARDCPNVGVFKDRHDADPARRYKMVSDVGLGRPQVRFSADGIHWGPAVQAEGFGPKNGDTHNNAFWDEASGRYLWFTKLYLGERLVARFQSDDFLTWRSDGMVLRSSVGEGRDSQTYCMPVFRHAGIYIGFLMMYHVGAGRTVDCELAWSPDGLRWRRVAAGEPLIPRGPKGAYDSECIYAMAGPPITRDGRHLIFYGGDDFPHTGWKRHCLPCLATLREDGFAGYEPVAATLPAVLTTRPLRTTGEPFRVIADGEGVEVTAVDERGLEVGRSSWPGRDLRLRLVFDRAKVYGLEGVALVDRTLPAEDTPRDAPAHMQNGHVVWTSENAADGKPVAPRSHGFDFESGAQAWTGVDTVVPHDGFLTLSRSGRNLPIAASSPRPGESPLVGDWTRLVGGRGARIACRVRSEKPGNRVLLEVFARDVAAWQYQSDVGFAADWREVVADLRYDWSDEEARAAGWTPALNAFSWRETIRNVGKIVVVPGAAGEQSSFDLDDVRVTGTE